jgi:hypothetical protein
LPKSGELPAWAPLPGPITMFSLTNAA